MRDREQIFPCNLGLLHVDDVQVEILLQKVMFCSFIFVCYASKFCYLLFCVKKDGCDLSWLDYLNFSFNISYHNGAGIDFNSR